MKQVCTCTTVFVISAGVFLSVSAQSYISYMTGDSADVTTNHLPGIVLAGGGGDNDDAMKWMLQRGNGGDVVVLRVSNSNGYNSYFYNSLGVSVNSVETLVIPSVTAAFDPYVEKRIKGAEVLFIAGGDQAEYVNYWKDTPVESAINYLITTKKATVGGTSAGCAIQGQAYFSALNGTITSLIALNNPYNSALTLGYNDFLLHPALQHTITDTHYDNPDRRGRHVAFLARLMTDFGFRPLGIGIDEYTAVCIDDQLKAFVFGEFPTYNDYAYFLQANCVDPAEPETCAPNQKLTWVRNNEAVKVYKVPGTSTGTHFFDLSQWNTGSGGTWENWYVNNGTLFITVNASPALCSLASYLEDPLIASEPYLTPIPANDMVLVHFPFTEKSSISIQVYDFLGRLRDVASLSDKPEATSTFRYACAHLPIGAYVLHCRTPSTVYKLPLIITR